MNQEQTNITTGKQIRHLRTQLGMTQEELAGELNVTRQALSNWERDVNEPDLNMLKKICFLFGVNMDDFAKEVITKMETYEKKEKRQFNKYDMAIGLFYGVGIFLGIGIFFVGGFMTMSGAGWGASLVDKMDSDITSRRLRSFPAFDRLLRSGLFVLFSD